MANEVTDEDLKFGYTVKESPPRRMPRPIGMRCEECGSENVQIRGYLYWDKDEQRWHVDEPDWDWTYCNDCEESCCVDEYNL